MKARTFIGDIQNKIVTEINNNAKATIKETKEYILRKYQENPTLADLIISLMDIKGELYLKDNDLPLLEDLDEHFYQLELHPLDNNFFVNTPYNKNRLGIIFNTEKLSPKGIVYTATVFFEPSLSNGIVRTELRMRQDDPEPFLSLLSTDGYIYLTKNESMEDSLLRVILKSLLAYKNNRRPTVPLSSIKGSIIPRKNRNLKLEKLIADAYTGSIQCARVEVPIELIEIKDIDYALSIPQSLIETMINSIQRNRSCDIEILLYEDNKGKLVMDDDYSIFLAYKAINKKTIRSVIVGKYDKNKDHIKTISIGNGNLIPAIILYQEEKSPRQISKKELLDAKIKKLAKEPIKNDENNLMFSFIEFCRLLKNEKTKERDLHNFLLNHPRLIDINGTHVMIHSEVKIGDYIADLVLEYHYLHKGILLIELERQSDIIFTKKGRLRSKVTHALQQVEDWIKEIRENKPNIPNWLKNEYTPEGMVIIGRSNMLSMEDKLRLKSINNNRTVKILTYDDLLQHLMQLIENSSN
ncbi:Shedu anti-phage system protein SduA domain-containing protein [Serratia sp. NPDC087055]|uniref:Shedu anti-phage system protein SduA domain-containing protein n=1 Tax=Serratia sp. NPDC087055 TaxID=3364516 RepID=UPI00385033AA